jgi:hypothetical protein
MRLESQIIEDELVDGFDVLEETMIILDSAEKYVKRIRSESKKMYASDYFQYLKGESGEPEVPSNLTFLDAQNVRINLQEITEGLLTEKPISAKGWTSASVEKFGKTIGKSPKEHGFFDACVSRMEGKKGFDGDKAKRFCASIKDASYGSAFWRGKGKAKKEIETDVKKKPFPKGQQLKKVTEAKIKKTGDSVKVPHKGKMVIGKIVRYDDKDKHATPVYIVNVGEPASIRVPVHKIQEAMKIKCSRCGKTLSGKDEYDAEMKFNMHKCKGKRDLHDMPTDLLKLVATKKMKEDDAWKELDIRMAKK